MQTPTLVYGRARLYAGGTTEPEWWVKTEVGYYRLSGAISGPATPEEIFQEDSEGVSTCRSFKSEKPSPSSTKAKP